MMAVETKAERRKRRRRFVDSWTTMSELVAILLDDEEDATVMEDAIRAFWRHATESANKWGLPNFQEGLAGVVRALFRAEMPEVQRNSAWAIANLASYHNHKNKARVASFPRVLQGLVELLQRDENPGIQEEAARAIRNLACEESNNQIISQFPEALSSLLRLLSDGESSPEVQTQCTMAVINLLGNSVATRTSGTKPLEAELDMLSAPDALTGIVKLLFEESSCAVQEQAAYALVDLVENTLVNRESLVGGSEETGNAEKIADFPEALVDLVRLFSYDPLESFPLALLPSSPSM